MNEQTPISALSRSQSSSPDIATPVNTPPRCQYRTPSGRQCRSVSSSAASSLCARHNAIKKQRRSAGLAAVLTGDNDSFHSAEGIHHSLAQFFTLLAEDRISPRRAAVLAYVGSLLLRTLPAMEKEQTPKETRPGPMKIVWDLPSPPREEILP